MSDDMTAVTIQYHHETIPIPLVIDGVTITSMAGMCPLQAEGTIDDYPFYFRARGKHVSLQVHARADATIEDVVGVGSLFGGDQPGWFYREQITDEQYMAGYLEFHQALYWLGKCIALYRIETGQAKMEAIDATAR